MHKNFIEPPLTDRGVQNTSGAIYREKNILIDWFECTLKNNVHPEIIFTSFLHIPKEEIDVEDSGLYGYKMTYSWRDIKIMTSLDNSVLGTHVLISGKGCRDIESLNVDWLELFGFLTDNFDMNITRIDIAIDTFTDKYFTLQKLRDYIKNKQVVSRFKSSTEFIQKSLSTSDIESETIWFGSRTSNIQIVFYNKLMERTNASYEVDPNIKYWYRCESRFRNEIAMNLVKTILNNGDYIKIINDVLYNYLDFKDISYTESNRSRWITSFWWLDFLETNKKLSLKVNLKESSIVSKKRWLNDSVSKSQFMVYVSDLVKDTYTIDMLSSNYIYSILKEGFSKIKDKDMKVINEFRINNGLQPLNKEDLKDIVSNVSSLLI